MWGWGSSLQRYSSQILIHHMWMRDQPVPVWMDVVSLILYLSDFHSARFMMVLSDVCSNFRYNFDVIVQRGEPCLHMPPS